MKARNGFQAVSKGALALFAAMVLFGSGCATTRPVHPERKGFFATLEQGEKSRAPAGKRHFENDAPDSHLVVKKFKPKVHHWVWPLKNVQVTSQFGPRGKEFHEGIDLRAKVGTPVYAVDVGKVLYSGSRIRGYGKMIVIRHPSGLATIYAHNSRLLVRPGQKIRRGQRIAISGQSGHVSGPHLHFEIRDGVAAIDPVRLLPSVKTPIAETRRRVQTVVSRK